MGSTGGRPGRRRRGRSGVTGDVDGARAARLSAGRVYAELAEELPDEDLAEDLRDTLDLYEPGSKPAAEEAEYLVALQTAIERLDDLAPEHGTP